METLKKLFGTVGQVVGYFFTALVIVRLTKDFGKIELNGLPNQIYATYVAARNSAFEVVRQIFFSWWISITIPDLIKDIVSVYLFFGLSLVRSEDIIPLIYKHVLRAGTLKVGKSELSNTKLFLIALRRVFLWPIDFVRYVVGWSNFEKNNQPRSSLADEQKRALAKIQKNIRLAGILSYPFALTVAAVGAICFFLWSYLEGIFR